MRKEHSAKRDIHHPFAALSRAAENAACKYIVFSPEMGENTIHQALRAADAVLSWERLS